MDIINKRTGLITAVAAVLIVIITATSFSGKNKNTGEVNNESGQEIIIEHELGETKLNKLAERPIVFDYGALDVLDNIGIEPIGLPKSNLPSYLDHYDDKRYTDLGSLKEPNFEKIYEEKPDLIIVSSRQADMYDEFNEIAPTIYLGLDDGDYMKSLENNLEILGKSFGKEDIIKNKLNLIKEDVARLSKQVKTSDDKGLTIMVNDGSLSAYGVESRFGVIHNEFAVKQIDKDIGSARHGQNISFEYITEKNPDLLFVVDRAAVVGGDNSAKEVLENDIIKETDAYKNDNIIYLDPHVWYVSTGGLTSTNKMIEDIEQAFK